MRAIDVTLGDAAENLRLDDTLLRMAEAGQIPGALRFWESSHWFVVLGRSGQVADELQRAAIEQDGVPVYRRSSGGGTVVQGPGCLNFAIVRPKQDGCEDVRESYRCISARILDVLRQLHVHAQYEPISDLAIAGRKFSGNAQRRSRRFLLHHGTLLYDFDLGRITRYLKLPVHQPPYRAHRCHTDFVRNVPIVPQAFKWALADAMNAKLDVSLQPEEEQALATMGRLSAIETLFPGRI